MDIEFIPPEVEKRTRTDAEYEHLIELAREWGQLASTSAQEMMLRAAIGSDGLNKISENMVTQIGLLMGMTSAHVRGLILDVGNPLKLSDESSNN